MPGTDLVRLLNSIGKSTFVRYYRQFSDRTLSHEDLVDLLPKEYTLKARHTRVSKARRILDEGLHLQALIVRSLKEISRATEGYSRNVSVTRCLISHQQDETSRPHLAPRITLMSLRS